MRLTKEQIKDCPDGTLFKLFYSGNFWDDDFGKAVDVVKIGKRLYRYTDFFEINEIDEPDYETEVASNDRKFTSSNLRFNEVK